MGATAEWLSQRVPTHTIELNTEWAGRAIARFKNEDVACYCGNSPHVMRRIVPRLERPVFYLLDAHWNKDWPLLRELAVLARHQHDDAVIAIHDCKVPHRPDLAFDTWEQDGVAQPIELSLVLPSIRAIYGEGGYRLTYNDHSEEGKPGVLFITPTCKQPTEFFSL